MSNTLTKKELTKYLGPAVVSANDYQSYMWRIEDDKGKSSIIKCAREDNCIHYYIDEGGVEHRDGLFNIEQLPVAYRSMKYLTDSTDGVNTNTKLSYDLVCMLFGEPEVDRDIPFVYKWNRGDYVLESTGSSFSLNRLGEDIRETVQIVGNLPLAYRQILDSQRVSSTLMAPDVVSADTISYNEYDLQSNVSITDVEPSLAEAINKLEAVPEVISTPVESSIGQEPSLLELSSKDVELLLNNIGATSVGEEELEEQFKASVTLDAEAKEQAYETVVATDRKQIVSTQEPESIPEAPEDFLEQILKIDSEVEEAVEIEKVIAKAPAKKTPKKPAKKLGRPKKIT